MQRLFVRARLISPSLARAVIPSGLYFSYGFYSQGFLPDVGNKGIKAVRG